MVEQLVIYFRQHREQRRKELARTINPREIERRMRPPIFVGIDENGKRIRTREPARFGILIHNRVVEFSTYRDDRKYLAGMTQKDAERLVRKKAQGKIGVHAITDVFQATRLFKHIKEGYRTELLDTDPISVIERINAFLAASSSADVCDRANALLTELRDLETILSRTSNASKRLALAKLRDTCKALDDLSACEGGFASANRIGVASALLVAFRNRYEDWRVEEILRRGSRAYLKECAMRAVRDRVVREHVANWISTMDSNGRNAAFALRNFFLDDRARIAILETMKLSNVEAVVKFLENSGIRFGQTYVETAKLHLAHGEIKKAFDSLRRLYYFLQSNKPMYIALQLEETADPYMVAGEQKDKTFIAYLKSGAGLFEFKVFERAAYCFRKAMEVLDRTVAAAK